MNTSHFSSRLPDLESLTLAIAENSVHGLVVMDDMGYCLYANRAWLDMTGFSEEEMRAKPVHDLVHHHRPDGRPFPMEECPIGCTLGKNMRVRNHEDLFFRKDGSPLPVSCAASPIVQDGAPVLMILETRDITAEKEADRRTEEFLAMLAHELRNPLAPIAAAADLLTLAPSDSASVRQVGSIISRQVSHMTGLVDDLLDVSRVTRGLVSLKRESVDVTRILHESVEQVRPLMESRGHRLSVTSLRERTLVHGDSKRLVQVLVNLLNNAAKFTPPGGEVDLRAETTGETVTISVSDTGIGMSGETIARAFELFSQAQRNSDRLQGGLGIGLALVRKLVELHGGNVSAHSPGTGSGSRFTISLPCLANAGPDNGPLRQPDSAEAGAPSLKILLVDDNSDAAQALAALLRTMGHEVLVEEDPRSALERAEQATPHVFLLDIGLPGMDGYELARHLRRRPEHERSVLVALTGYGQDQDREAALAAGFDHHIVKPASMQQLAELLKRASQSSPAPGLM